MARLSPRQIKQRMELATEQHKQIEQVEGGEKRSASRSSRLREERSAARADRAGRGRREEQHKQIEQVEGGEKRILHLLRQLNYWEISLIRKSTTFS